jgi:hypothetical protein
LSVVKFTQVAGGPAHSFGRFAGQPQTPAVQAPPRGQAVPQDLQSVGLVWRFWQPSAQVVSPLGHEQTPAVQVEPAGHAFPQAEQLAGSVCVLVHTELHVSGVAIGQTQEPAVQVAPTAQAVPHVPQLLLSVCVLVQLPLQSFGVAPVHEAPSIVFALSPFASSS